MKNQITISHKLNTQYIDQNDPRTGTITEEELTFLNKNNESAKIIGQGIDFAKKELDLANVKVSVSSQRDKKTVLNEFLFALKDPQASTFTQENGVWKVFDSRKKSSSSFIFKNGKIVPASAKQPKLTPQKSNNKSKHM